MATAADALGVHLIEVLRELEPALLGLYWAMRSEFNAAAALSVDRTGANLPRALPFSQREPVRMDYRRWDGRPPATRDECGIPTGAGAVVVPDVVLVPCVGFTPTGHRLGYGGGYFDRWLALHPGTTSVGVAWAIGEMAASSYVPEPHDQRLTLIVTEHGVR